MDPNMPGLAVEPIRALIPAAGDRLIFGCDSSLWLMSGNPASGGQLSALSRNIGVVGADAWCAMPDGATLILSRDGVYMVPPGSETFPVALSSEVLPRDLIDVDTTANAVSLAYDSQGRGVHVFVTPYTSTQGQHWWLDLGVKGFWPDAYPTAMQPSAVACYAAAAGGSRLTLLGGKDGYVRKFSASATTDDGTAIQSRVVYGPLAIGQASSNGKIIRIDADLASSSGSVTWETKAADTQQGAVSFTSPSATGTWAAGSNPPTPHVGRGNAAAIRVSGTGQWGIERIGVTVEPSGRAG
jgi:hypothetical protein